MGPNPIRLLERLLDVMPIERGSRVLDLGSGRGATSVYLARELACEVVAVDLWIDSAEAAVVHASAGVADRVRAVHADVRALPLEDASVDVVVSIDAWEYFGADASALAEVARVLRPGGSLGMATPALRTEPVDAESIPPHVRSVFGDEALQWHRPGWWADHWTSSGWFGEARGDFAVDGWADWLAWERMVLARAGEGGDRRIVETLERDGGRELGFAVVTAHRLATSG
jgi:cyclopropane fatty-acyl-phospholipid synthase-like methyltransferase